MGLPRQLIKGGSQVAAGQLGQQLLLLARNIFVARLLPAEQFGIALTFMTVLNALDALTEMGIELFIVRSPNAHDERLQKTLQTLLIFRGLVAGAGILLLAGPVAKLFGVPEAAWAYQWLAVVPVIRGFLHLDYRRFERDLKFLPGSIVLFASFLAGTVAAIVAAYYLRSAISIAIGAIVQMIVQVICSHLAAERSYRLAYERSHASELMTYGAPLILNGILLFSLSQGDRIVVASILGVRELENYGVVAILTTGITLLVMRITSAIYLPLLSEHAPGTPTYLKRYEACGAATALMATGIIFGFGFVGYSFVKLAFGQQYEPTQLLVALLGVQVGLKVIRSWPQRAFLANAQTGTLFLSNLIAAAGLVLAFFAANWGYGIEGVAACMALPEFVAAVFSVRAISQNGGLLWAGIRYVGITVVAAAGIVAMHVYGLAPTNNAYEIGALLIACGICFACILAMSPSFGQLATEAVRKFKS